MPMAGSRKLNRDSDLGHNVRTLRAEPVEPRFIVVEGPIGVGKSSLARRLAESLQAELILEPQAENPFLERFYKEGRNAALQTQLFFLFQRAQQVEQLRQSDMFSPVRVADFLFDRDRLVAEINLDPQEMNLYEQIASKMELDPPVPNLVVYLQATADSLMQRIARRGIAYERSIDRGYVEKLADAYARFFHSYDEAPLLIVNASSIDPINNESDYQQLFQQISRTTGGRHFFNPAATAILA